MFSKFTNKRAETILEVTIALFIIGVGITVSSMVLNRSLNVTAQNKLWLEGVYFAKEGLEGVRNLSDTNLLRYSDPGCWKTIETADVCDPTTPNGSPMMANSEETNFYSMFFDYVDFTWSLVEANSANDWEDNAIIARLPNEYSIFKKYLGPSETLPIYIGQTTGAENTFFYRRIHVESITLDVDQDDSDEVLMVTSEVKWPYRNKVFHYETSTELNQTQ
ncbi:MAG: hypothetical protein Q8P68_05240 [Candidatus Peregrinibacteria bacterium]|nr:hypothetical protein [Candidatus Peregrinibacteria bacterium]MDZ4244831.1 hypothetical protein [Candidatus Gracilibacteria bacterium]